MMIQRILVVEDEQKIADLIGKYLALDGFEFHHASNGHQAMNTLEQIQIDLVVLDVMLPDMDGIRVCERIRASSNVPIIMLTARVDEVDRLLGFAKGADDYVCKPFNPPELMARIKAILRRVGSGQSSETLTHGQITLTPNEHSVKVGELELQLTQIEFSLLHTFMANPNHVFSREELLVASHGKYSESYERTIDFHIKNLRKKIYATGESECIKSIYGVGYKFD